MRPPPAMSPGYNGSVGSKDATMPSSKPIFLLTHPRSISTAFERIFVTRERDVVCVHEPFSDAYHWGPEKLSQRYQDLEERREKHGYKTYTYKTALQIIEDAMVQFRSRRVFVKDMAKCLMPLPGATTCFVPSLDPSLKGNGYQNGNIGTEEGKMPKNPTVLPLEFLSEFHFAFLIRHPRKAIPSLYECSTPPKCFATGWHGFKATDAGYRELRVIFDYLLETGQIGPGSDNAICLVDADDLLAYPEETVQSFCASVGLDFEPSSLYWVTEKDQQRAQEIFNKLEPFHRAALQSTSLREPCPERTSPEADMAAWTAKYGKEAAALIQKNVEENMADYLYLKKFAIRPSRGVRSI